MQYTLFTKVIQKKHKCNGAKASAITFYKKTYKQVPYFQFPVIEQQYAKPCKT